jgi:hypothetical protein
MRTLGTIAFISLLASPAWAEDTQLSVPYRPPSRGALRLLRFLHPGETLIMTDVGFTGRGWVKSPAAARLDRNHNGLLSQREIQLAPVKGLYELVNQLDAESSQRPSFLGRQGNMLRRAADILAEEFTRRGLPAPWKVWGRRYWPTGALR